MTNRCKGALVWSVFSSSVLVQCARARARLWLSGHTLLSAGVKKRERDVSGSLSGGQDSPFSARSAGLIMLPADELPAGTDQPAMRECRCSASVFRATLMRYRDARHTPPPLSVVLVLLET